MCQFQFGHEIGDHFGADMGGLLLHLLHQPGALDDVGKAWIVFHVGSDGELAAGLDALDQHRFQHRTRGVDRCRISRRARTDDDDLGVDGGWHGQVRSRMGDARRFSGNCPKGSARAPKLSFPSLRHVASYASFAIHLGDFSLNCEKWRSARAIKLRNPYRLR